MALFKKKMNEQEVCASYINTISKATQESWPEIYRSLKECAGDKNFAVKDEQRAINDLNLALFSLGFMSMDKLFPELQAMRIKTFIEKNGLPEQYQSYGKRALQEYRYEFEKSLNENSNAVRGLAIQLLQRWVGEDITKFHIKSEYEDTKKINPMLTDYICTALVPLVNVFSWKKIKSDYNLV